ncbi:MAG: TadG family pilus assembly protein [Hyphomicrobium sp.]
MRHPIPHFSPLEITSRLARDERGTIALLTAAFLTVAIAVSALAIDVGALYLQRRSAQGYADLAAIAASADLGRPEAAARATLHANGLSDIKSLSVVLGRYQPDPAVAADQRFVAGLMPYNAAHVDLITPGRLYFAKYFFRSDVDVGVTAMASSAEEAAFSVGSRLLSLDGGISNAVLGALLGGSVSLTAMDYEALLDADVKLLSFMGALATEAGITAGTYRNVLEAEATLGQWLTALASVCEEDGNASAAASLRRLAGSAISSQLTVPLTSLIDLGSLASLAIGEPAPGLDVTMQAMELVSGAAVLSNGARQVAIDLGATVPGIVDLDLKIAIGEPMQHSAWVAVGGAGSMVRTAQTRLTLVAYVAGSGLLSDARIRLPIYLEVASAEARLAAVSCPASGYGRVEVAVLPGIAEAWIGEPTQDWSDTPKKPAVNSARIVTLPLLTINGRAHVRLGNQSETMLDFTQSDIDAGVIRQTDTHAFTASLASTLLGDLELEVNAVGLRLSSPAAVQAALAATLSTAAPPLDKVVHALLTTLGLHLGQADVRVNAVRCRGGVLTG